MWQLNYSKCYQYAGYAWNCWNNVVVSINVLVLLLQSGLFKHPIYELNPFVNVVHFEMSYLSHSSYLSMLFFLVVSVTPDFQYFAGFHS